VHRTDTEAIHAIVNDAEQAYKGMIPEDVRHELYMSMEEPEREIETLIALSDARLYATIKNFSQVF
jgi:hypothetical protein